MRREPLIGVARLATMAFRGFDLLPTKTRLLARLEADPSDAPALLDLSTLLQLELEPRGALELQARALACERLYHVPCAAERPAARLLAIMAPGDFMTNTPIEFLVEHSSLAVDLLFVDNDSPPPASPPPCDAVFVAIGASDAHAPLLERLEARLSSWHRPIVNRPERIGRTERLRTQALLRDAPGVLAAPIERVRRAELIERVVPARGEQDGAAAAAGANVRTAASFGERLTYPLLVRPVESHGGHGLAFIADSSALERYARESTEDDVYVSRFVDYRSADGLFRKYRIVLIDGRAYAVHMAISEHWMVHYLNAGMTESAEKRAEEARFMAEFDRRFASRHERALDAIARRVGLDYLVVDCAELPDGRLLVFEVDGGGIVHAMDPAELFPYKPRQMRRVFAAFEAMVLRRAGGG